MILSVLVLPMIAFKTVPSVQKKVSYMIYDMQMLSVGKGSNYSDSERLISMAAGAKLIRENLIFGVGTGDIKDAMNTIYDRDYPYIDINNRKLPHNQFIWMWASNGILGITAFLVSIFYPLLYKKNYKNLLLLMFSIITMSSFVTEHTLEIQVGIAFYVIWMTIILNYLNGLNEDEYRV
jgi:O-antigen ligase